ncbi:MAG: Abi family protein [Bacteroidales bacterium]|nr:Abi family protein [Bacteroidales bacterium]
MKAVYKGDAFSIPDIMDMLRRQGLIIEDEKYTTRVLSNLSYSRLKPYIVPFLEPAGKDGRMIADTSRRRFRPGTTFDDIYACYGFDRRLRELIFHEMEKIEVSIRTRIAYACNGQENGYWFLNPKYFKTGNSHERILKHVRYELERTDNEGIREFYSKYSNEFPPSWLTLEATSMGTMWTIYDELSSEALRERIAAWYGLSPRIFSNWMKHLVAVRNDCAHHNRVWDSTPTRVAMIPQEADIIRSSFDGAREDFPSVSDKDRRHIYLTLCIIRYMQNHIKPENSFAARLKILVNNFPKVNPSIMGFPPSWQEDPFWK